MPKKLTTEEFIEKSIEIHGNKYNYLETEYECATDKIKIFCNEHKEFFRQLARDHIYKKAGCPKCGRDLTDSAKIKSKDSFIEKAKEIHKDKYSYENIVYVNRDTEIEIYCKEHSGNFIQKPSSHLAGRGCNSCSRNQKRTTSEFIEKAMEIHGSKYDYSYVVYRGKDKKVSLICKEHGVWETRASVHLKGFGCPACSGNKPYTTESFIERARQVHGNKYVYSLVNYEKANRFIEIICPFHNKFTQKACSHLQGKGCKKCFHEENDISKRYYSEKPAILYYVKIHFEDKYFYKVGVTCQSVKQRFRNEINNGRKVISLYEEKYEFGGDAYRKEREILSAHREYLIDEQVLLYGGNTEIFSRDVLNLDI